MFELTAFIDRQRKQKLVAAIKEGARLINECQDERKQWAAMHELRKLQLMLNHPAI
jgi:hypothetical protein